MAPSASEAGPGASPGQQVRAPSGCTRPSQPLRFRSHSCNCARPSHVGSSAEPPMWERTGPYLPIRPLD